MRRTRALTAALTAAVAAVALAACTGTDSLVLPASSAPATASATGTTTSTPAPTCTPQEQADELKSYAPSAAGGPYVEKIRKRKRLIVGVSADTLLFGYRDPLDPKNRIVGFDIDVLHQIAKALLGDENKITYKVITAGQRIPSLAGDPDETVTDPDAAPQVDIVARTMSITCARWKSVDFSTEYFRAGQSVLVAKGQQPEIAALTGKKVCAPAGTSSLEKLKTFSGPEAVPVARHTDCLALFQQGKVDAITGDNTILAGFAAQDPYATVGTKPFTRESYGLAIGKNRRDFVQFVNQVLLDMRRNGEWAKAYDTWLAEHLGPPTPPPVAGPRPLG